MRLIDSSAWIPTLRPRGTGDLPRRVNQLIEANEVAITGVVRLELLLGARDQKQLSDMRQGFSGLVYLETTERTWEIAEELGFRLYRSGAPTLVPDIIIAASAIEHDLVLLHADADFDRIAEHSELKVESYA